MKYLKIIEDTKCKFCHGTGLVDFCEKKVDCSKCAGDGFTMEEILVSFPQLIKILETEKEVV